MPTINGLRVYEYGSRKNRPVIFIHGFPMSSGLWANQIEALQSDYNCFAYDVRGLGQSETGDGQYTIDSFADDLFSLISVMGLHKPVICGLSMGGYIALRAIERQQSVFGGVILCCTRSEADTNEAKIRRAESIRQINYEGTRRYISEFLTMLPAPANSKRISEDYLSLFEEWLKNSSAGVKGCLLALAGRTDTTESLGGLNIPALVIAGEEDRLIPPAVMKTMASKIRGAEFAAVSGCGHLAPLEAPAQVNEKIKKFLAGLH